MGGMRAFFHHLQRTAIQASSRMVAPRPAAGSRARCNLDDDVHPFTKPLSSLRIGDTIHAGPRVITLQDIEHFA
jgi:oxepin-CoA hydrolase / 3-oxo-5,6-dehydrosuberyl-CoA semialdehyde dehydrogenase